MYSLYYDGFFEPISNLPTNWQATLSNIGWRSAQLYPLSSAENSQMPGEFWSFD